MGILDVLASQMASQVLSQQLSSLATMGLNSLLGTSSNPPSPFNIDEFRNNISNHGDLAKEDKFQVQITLPYVVQQASGAQNRELTLQCEAAELPGRDINMIEYRHYGFIKRIPHMIQYGQSNFTFLATGDMWEKQVFDMWLDVMLPSQSGLVTYPMDANNNSIYETTVGVTQYNQNGTPIYGVSLLYAVPVAMTPMTLDWNADTPHKMQVTFAYRKWLSPTSTTAIVPPTDFGQQVGGSASLSPLATSPINNMTNNPQSTVQGSFNNLVNGLIPTISI